MASKGGKTVQVRSPSESGRAADPLRLRRGHGHHSGSIQRRDLLQPGWHLHHPGTAKTIAPGFRTEVGLKNFVRFRHQPGICADRWSRSSLWNFIFPTVSVLSTFALGLAIAHHVQRARISPSRRLIRSLLLIPYTIPGLISIIIWRGMLNPEFGVVNKILNDLIGTAPRWTTEAFWAQTAILLVNLWLGYPYMMLVTSGALQSIPSDIYEAAMIDGATGWQRFRRITLPLLLVAVGPLLIASYVYNFNNFNLIYLFIAGGPPIPAHPRRQAIRTF
ncbi:MAG: ABC transporter permease subunit [Candidatus Moduliflexus flocculans]|nr:ABC transporter permease subunit [Candidatus Moduliflexus flocculans]